MSRPAGGLVGRDEELTALHADDPGAADGRLLVLAGPPGSGRSAVLAELGRRWEAEGVPVLRVDGGSDAPPWDRYGVHRVLHAVRDRFEHLTDTADITDTALAAALATLAAAATPAAYDTAARRSDLVAELGRLLSRLAPGGRAAVLVDDGGGAIDPTVPLAAQAAGHRVVAAATGRGGTLARRADRVVELPDLTDDEADALLRRALRAPLDPDLLAAVRDGLGPWRGNPAALTGAVAELRRRDRLVTVRRHLRPRDPAEAVVLPDAHRLVTDVDAAGPAAVDLVVLACGSPALSVDHVAALARTTGRPVAETGATLDRLLLAGVLTGGDRLTVACPAVGATMCARVGAPRVRALHAALAVAVDRDRGVPARPADVADRLVAAGDGLAPDPAQVGVLRVEASRVEHREPARAAARLAAAWWHAPPGPDRDRIEDVLVPLLVRAGDHDRLARFVAAAVEADPDTGARRPARAAGAALAALHLGRPVPDAVAARLTAPPATHLAHRADAAACPVTLAARWCAGGAPDLEEFVAAFAVLVPAARTGDRPASRPTLPDRVARRRRRTAAAARRALASRDLVAVLDWMLGPAYGAPAQGAAAAVHRVHEGYAAGRWEAALSAAREVEAGGGADPRTRGIVTLLATEMSVWSGDERGAAAWREPDPAAAPAGFPALRGWVDCGTRLRAGDPHAALAVGWDAWRAAGASTGTVGGRRLLLRMATVALEGDHHAWQRHLLRSVRAQPSHDEDGAPEPTRLLLEGVLDRDAAAVEEGLALTRARGHSPDLAWALAAAGLATGDPAPRLQEAHGLALEIGAHALRACVRRSMDDRGVAVPTARPRDDAFTPVQLEIVALIRRGRTNRQIARAIRMSEKTVENHLTRLFLKVGCRTRHGLATATLDGVRDVVGA